MFSGSMLTTIDQKRRVSIPAIFRNAIPGDAAAKRVFVSSRIGQPYLLIAGSAMLAVLAGRLNDMEAAARARNEPFDRELEGGNLTGGGAILPLDSSGRLVMPEDPLDVAGIEGPDLFCYAVTDRFQLWDVKRLLATEDARYANQRGLVQSALRTRDKLKKATGA